MMTQTLLHYTYLQLLDLLTTIAFLAQGVQEGNPIVRFAMQAVGPISGLMAIKVLALGLGLYCWRSRKDVLLGRVNLMFAALVAWNLLALIAGSTALS